MSVLFALIVGTALAIPPQEAPPVAPPPAEGDDRRARTVGEFLDKFPGPQDGFMLRLQSLCEGGRYEGRMVTDDPADADMRGEALTMGPAACETAPNGSLTRVAIPFAVGDDATRSWVIDRRVGGVRLKHGHVGEDGTPDALSGYGGDTTDEGTFTRQTFPADAESRALFGAEGIPASNANVWAVEIVPGDAFAYELRRPGRAFRAEFDLARTAGAAR